MENEKIICYVPLFGSTVRVVKRDGTNVEDIGEISLSNLDTELLILGQKHGIN